MRREQIGRVRRQGTGGNGHQIWDRWMGHTNEIEARGTSQIRTQASIRPASKTQQSANTRFAKGRVYQYSFVTELSQRDGEVRCCRCLTFPGQCASYQNHLWWLAGLRQEQGSAQGTERF